MSTPVIGLTISTSLLLMACLYLYVRSLSPEQRCHCQGTFGLSTVVADYCEEHKRPLAVSPWQVGLEISAESTRSHICKWAYLVNISLSHISFTYLHVSISRSHISFTYLVHIIDTVHSQLCFFSCRRKQGTIWREPEVKATMQRNLLLILRCSRW